LGWRKSWNYSLLSSYVES